MRSPLNSYANPGGEIYISTVGMIQNAANAVATAGLTVDAKVRKTKAEEDQMKAFKRIGTFDADDKEYTQGEYDLKYSNKKDSYKKNKDGSYTKN